jgi:hypothetical protein
MLRIPHCLNNRQTDGGKVLSIAHWPLSTPQKHYLSASGTHFLLEAESQGLVRLEGLGKLKKKSAGSIVPQPLRSRFLPKIIIIIIMKFVL